MSTLDNPNVVDPQPASMNPTVFRYGLIGGLVFIIFQLLGNLTGFSRPTNFSAVIINGLLSFAIYIGLMIFAIRHHRDKDLSGYISFGRAFVVGLLVVLIAGIISSIFNYLYITMIDPDYVQNMMEDMQGMYERLGMSEDQIEEMMLEMESSMTPGRIFLQGLIGQLVIGAIVAAIVALIMKKSPPETV